WIRQVLHAADRRLTEVRRGVPDAGGLVIASDHEAARAYARHIRDITGTSATVVLSDDPRASKKLKESSDSDDRWMVAVRMVSEGVDIPRLCVGVYATSVSTPLFFAQAVGRFVRARRRGETASVFLPSVPTLMSLANEMENERDHVLGRRIEDDGLDDSLLEKARQKRDTPDAIGEELPFETVEASAVFDRVLFDGGEFGTTAEPGSPEEEDYIGLPGLLEPEQVAILLRKRQAERQAAARKAAKREEQLQRAPHEELAALRKELNGLVGAWNHRTGQPHGITHAELRRICGGPPVAQATAEQLRKRIAEIRKWAARRSR